MKKVFIYFVFSILFVILFASCKIQGPSMCSITVKTEEGGTATVDCESAVLGTFVTLHVVPDEGYYCSEIKGGDYSTFYYIQDEEEANTYHVLVSRENFVITVRFHAKYKNRITVNTKKCKLSFEDIENSSDITAYEGKKVSFTVNPDTNYLVDTGKIVVNGDGEVIPVTQDETNPNKFSFIMPDSSVTVYAECIFGLFITPEKKTYQKGDKVVFNIENNTNLTKGDLYYQFAGNFESSYVSKIEVTKFKKDFDLTAKTFEYSATKPGEITFYLYQDSNYLPLCNIEVRFPGLPDDTLPLYFELIYDKEVDYTSWSEAQLERQFTFNVGYSKNTLYYYYKDAPENIMKSTNTMYHTEYVHSIEYCYDESRTVVFYVAGNMTDKDDKEYSYKSEEIEFDMPKYGDIYRKNTIHILSNDSGFGDWNDRPNDLNPTNYCLELDTETQADNYFSAEIDGENNRIYITSIGQTTAIPRLLKLYKKGANTPTDDTLFAEIWVTIPFSGNAKYTINKIKN